MRPLVVPCHTTRTSALSLWAYWKRLNCLRASVPYHSPRCPPLTYSTMRTPLSKNTRLGVIDVVLAGDSGFEPKLAESKSAVLTITLIPDGAVNGTRTHTTSLEGWRSTN